MVALKKLNPNPNVTVYAKLEGNNPGGSVKDRPALNMIRSALERGEINTETKLIEATSGNTGIAMALIANLFGLKIELVMPASSTRLICLLYPQQSTCVLRSQEAVDGVLNELQRDLVNILCATTQCQDCDNEGIAQKFF